MAAINTANPQAAFGFADGYRVIQRAAFDAASRVLRYHATAAELKLAQRQAARDEADRRPSVGASEPASTQP